jgi:hypothetical protein
MPTAGSKRKSQPSLAVFFVMDFMPAVTSIVGGKMPTNRVIDGVDQSDVLLGKSLVGRRESQLSIIAPDLVTAWKRWRIYLTDMHPTGIDSQRPAGAFSSDDAIAGNAKMYTIEANQR